MPATTLLRAIPVLPSLEVARSLTFFKSLGFTAWGWEDPPSYGGVERDGAELHFFTTGRKEVCEWTSCRVHCDDVSGIWEEAQVIGCVHPNGPLEDKPWGLREFAILDPFGVLVTFAQEAPESGA